MTDGKADIKALARRKELQEKRRQLMALAPKDAMERILQDSQPLPLVRAFDESRAGRRRRRLS